MVFTALALSGSLYAVAQVPQVPQVPGTAAPDLKRGQPAPPPRSADGRYGIQVLAATVNVHAEAASGSALLAQLQQGARLEADQRRGNWYRIQLADGRSGWIDYVVGKSNPNFSVDANPGLARGLPR
ncbi:MAG TPA: SH3 domain-containing protein, partial [Casimicrobiaceae bacterium]